MYLELGRIRVEAIELTGMVDEFAELVVCDEGILIDGYFADTCGLSWTDLARVLRDPLVQAKLEEADLLLK